VPFFGVLIGVEVKGKASVGVIYMPALDGMVQCRERPRLPLERPAKARVSSGKNLKVRGAADDFGNVPSENAAMRG
jgi:fructose-1,6-bisphosphatase/inositol monophosphatase family enzyme